MGRAEEGVLIKEFSESSQIRTEERQVLAQETPVITVSVLAGRLKNFYDSWRKITTDDRVLGWTQGVKILFETPVVQNSVPREPHWSQFERSQISEQVDELLEKGAVSKCERTEGEFISPIFLTPKPDGHSRLILNLKSLNEFIDAEHFKLEDLRTARDLVSEGSFMATLDLKDAYYVVPIAESYKKYLRFLFGGECFEFSCLPFGLNIAPYVFTKIMKPVVACLREQGYMSVIYLDDFLLIGSTIEECQTNVEITSALLRELGFIINIKKSRTEPSRRCKFLGFILDTESMLIELPEKKREKMLDTIKKFRVGLSYSIREFASFVGSLGDCCKASKYGWAYMKDLEREKMFALRENGDNFEAIMRLSDNVREDLLWWKSHIMTITNPIKNFKFEMEIFSDASLSGWGVCCNGKKTHGFWSTKERENHINYLELLSAFFGIKCFASHLKDYHILLRIDNTTAIAYINRMGGIQKRKLSTLAKDIWKWCEQRNLWLFASYIRSEENSVADAESRRLEVETEFALSNSAFKEITRSFRTPEIDLFASRTNTKCKKYVSWKKDPGSIAVDAFTIDWKQHFFYAFPPFSIILKVLKKVQLEKARGIIVVPQWPSQVWFPLCMSMFEEEPILFEPNINLIRSTNREPHPLWRRLTLVAGIISSKRLRREECQKRHGTSQFPP